MKSFAQLRLIQLTASLPSGYQRFRSLDAPSARARGKHHVLKYLLRAALVKVAAGRLIGELNQVAAIAYSLGYGAFGKVVDVAGFAADELYVRGDGSGIVGRSSGIGLTGGLDPDRGGPYVVPRILGVAELCGFD